MGRAVDAVLMHIVVHCENHFPLFVDQILSHSALVSRNVSAWIGSTQSSAGQLQNFNQKAIIIINNLRSIPLCYFALQCTVLPKHCTIHETEKKDGLLVLFLVRTLY